MDLSQTVPLELVRPTDLPRKRVTRLRSRVRPSLMLLVLLVAIFIGLCLVWVWMLPIGQPPDEWSHYDYIRHIAIEQTLPVYGQTMYIHGPALHKHAGYPPLYYLLATPIQMALGSLSMPVQVTALRLFSVGLSVLTMVLVYILGRMLAPQRTGFALAAAAVTGFNPMFMHLSASINSDTLLNLLYVALLIMIVHGLQTPTTSKAWLWGLGVLLGAGFLTKPTILGAGVAVGLVLCWLAWRQQGRRLRSLVLYGLIVGGITLVLSGWWFVRNWMLYGDPSGVLVLGQLPYFRHTQPFAPYGSLIDMLFARQTAFVPFWNSLARGFWGTFGHLGVLLPTPLYAVFYILTLGGLIGTLVWVVRRWGQRDMPVVQLRLLLGLCSAVIFAVTFWSVTSVSYRVDYQPQGRYLFPALAPIALMIVAGWQELLGMMHLRRFTAPLLILLMLAANVVALLHAVQAFASVR